MSAKSIEDFASSLLEEAKKFLEKAKDSKGANAEAPYLHAALMLGFCALEAYINVTADGFANRPELTVHEKGVLIEREVQLQDGMFHSTDKLRISKMEDRIYLLHQKFSKKGLESKAQWRSNLSGAIDLRNKLTHPKDIPAITVGAVEKAISAVIETINELFVAIYGRPLPTANMGLASNLDF